MPFLRFSFTKRLCLVSLLMMLAICQASGQYTISGPGCAFAGPYQYIPYQVTGTLSNGGTGDKWKITNGTINGAAEFTNPGNPYCPGISWSYTASTGTLAYYSPATATTPIAIITVNIISPGTIAPPYTAVPKGINATVQLTGSAVTTPCGPGSIGISYQWQKYVNGAYQNISGAILKDYTVAGSFSQYTQFRRLTIYNGQSANNNNGPAGIDPKIPPTAGGVSPPLQTISYTQVPATLTTTAASGGPYPGNYIYYWQSSLDKVNWSDIGATATGLNYTSPKLLRTTYFRVRVATGTLQTGCYSNAVVVNILAPLVAGTIDAGTQVISYNTQPAAIQGIAAYSGLCLGIYSYEWESSVDGVTFNKITSAPNNANYTPGPLTATTYFRRTVKLSCNTEQQYSNIVIIKVANPSDNANYVRERTFTHAGVIDFTTADYLSNIREVVQSTTYYDGLGRNIQMVLRNGSFSTTDLNPASSENARDMVSIKEYDNVGLEHFKYLPFAATDNLGTYKSNSKAQQSAFLQQQYNSQAESFFYMQTNFETSPLNRVEKEMAPGSSWVGSSRGVGINYYINTSLDMVKVWTVTNNATIGIMGAYVASLNPYATGALNKTISTDEYGKQLIEFKDKEGKVILKKVQLTATADNGNGSSDKGWLCTYYIYDDQDNLRCVVQPRGVELLDENNWDIKALNGDILNEQCFRYEYDARQRMIVKKVPGAGEVWMVYDSRDRLVMSQDAYLRTMTAQKWMVTVYDNIFNRSVSTYLITDPANKSASYHRGQAAGSITYPVVANYTNELLTETHYDDYTNLPTGLYSTLFNSGYGTYLTGVSSSPDFAEAITQTAALKGLPTWTKVKVLGTAGQFISTVNIYDEKARVIQSQTINITGGLDITTNQYSFSNQLLRSHIRHQKSGGLSAQSYEVATKNNYDDLGRIIRVDKNLNNAGWKTVSSYGYNTLGQSVKNNIGVKPNTNTTPVTPLAKLDYEYNIRGWLLSINKTYIEKEKNLANTNTTYQYFGMQLGYDKNGSFGTFTPKYNGNIAGIIWKSEGDQDRRKYDFTYDVVNRLTAANFNQYVSGAGAAAIFDKSAGIDFSVENLNYDANGNILSMWQKGIKSVGSEYIDQLTYNYNDNSNKLLNVIDAVNDPATKLGDFRTSGLSQPSIKTTTTEDYTYDANGNLVIDRNKDIMAMDTHGSSINGIIYNHLNLPISINVRKAGTGALDQVKGTINYTYDAAGNRLRKITVENAGTANNNIKTTTTTTYLAGFVYETKTDDNPLTIDYTDVLQFISQDYGRIRPLHNDAANPVTVISFVNDYFLRDHLGNTRMVLTDEQKTIYYPAATCEGTYSISGSTQLNTMVNYEKQFYNIDPSKIFSETNADINFIPSWNAPPESISNTKLYYNNNASPASNVLPLTPPNSSYKQDCIPAQTDGSKKLYKLNAVNNKTGLEFMIKVMAGDKIDIFGKSYFSNTEPVNNANSTTLTLVSLMTNFLLAPANGAIEKGLTAKNLNSLNSSLIPSSFFRGNNNETGTVIPKAYINYIFFDEQFKYCGGYGSRVGQSGLVKDHWYADTKLQNITVPKNGYIFVYVSNESNIDVFFDNLQVIHKPGPILEETHYYPFGLTMAGISSKAAGKLENKYKFNGGTELQSAEFSDGSGLEAYDATNRLYDPQLGRFWQGDELAEFHLECSPYVFGLNNPISLNDPLGLDPEKSTPEKPKDLEGTVVRSVSHNQMQAIYWQLRDHDKGFGVLNDILRARLERWDHIQRFMEDIHAQTRQQDEFVLEVAANFIPLGWITKVRYLKYAVTLFKLKRGVAVGRVFWSGGRDIAGKAAMDFAKAEGMQTLEMTLKGKVLEKLTDLTSYKFIKPLWDRASASFAKGAEGTVQVFQNATDGVSLTSTWRNIEYGILKEKGNIINYVDVVK